jgi:hypothetical protein
MPTVGGQKVLCIQEGNSELVQRLFAKARAKVHTNTVVASVTAGVGHRALEVMLGTASTVLRFDAVVVATPLTLSHGMQLLERKGAPDGKKNPPAAEKLQVPIQLYQETHTTFVCGNLNNQHFIHPACAPEFASGSSAPSECNRALPLPNSIYRIEESYGCTLAFFLN